MKRNKSLLLVLPIFLLGSCNGDYSSRTVYLAANYKLTYARYIDNYVIDGDPHIQFLKPYIDFINMFNKDNSQVNMYVEMINGKPHGYGHFNLDFIDESIQDLLFDFDYYCSYDGVYGGGVEYLTAVPDYVHTTLYRRRYEWVRMQITLPDVYEEDIIIQFNFTSMNDEPEEFNISIW